MMQLCRHYSSTGTALKLATAWSSIILPAMQTEFMHVLKKK